MQSIVYIRAYSLNTATVFYIVTECPDVTVLIWDVCRPHRIRTSPGLGHAWTLILTMQFSCLTLDVGCSVVRSVTS